MNGTQEMKCVADILSMIFYYLAGTYQETPLVLLLGDKVFFTLESADTPSSVPHLHITMNPTAEFIWNILIL